MRTKTKTLFGILLALTSFSLTSCALDGDETIKPETNTGSTSSVTPNDDVLNTFDIQFPNANIADWSTNGTYYVADFTEFSVNRNAWFKTDGEWVLTKTSLSYDDLQGPITKAFSESTYAANLVTQRSRLQRKGLGDVYIIGIQNSSRTANIYYTENGDLIRSLQTNSSYVDQPVDVSETISNFVSSQFNSATIVDIWNDDLGYKVGVVENGTYKVAALDSAYEWICTIWTVKETDVPSAVINSFKSSSYGTNPVSSIKTMENSTEITYLFYFTDGDKNKIATITVAGRIKSILSY